MTPPDIAKLRAALEQLVKAERMYRQMHDLHGGENISTGRAWDRMRDASDRAHEALALLPPSAENDAAEALERSMRIEKYLRDVAVRICVYRNVPGDSVENHHIDFVRTEIESAFYEMAKWYSPQSAEVESGWREMGSAPMDGSRVDLWAACGTVVEAKQ